MNIWKSASQMHSFCRFCRQIYSYLEKFRGKGVQIFENNVKIEWTEKSAIASGTLVAEESAVKKSCRIGREGGITAR